MAHSNLAEEYRQMGNVGKSLRQRSRLLRFCAPQREASYWWREKVRITLKNHYAMGMGRFWFGETFGLKSHLPASQNVRGSCLCLLKMMHFLSSGREVLFMTFVFMNPRVPMEMYSEPLTQHFHLSQNKGNNGHSEIKGLPSTQFPLKINNYFLCFKNSS